MKEKQTSVKYKIVFKKNNKYGFGLIFTMANQSCNINKMIDIKSPRMPRVSKCSNALSIEIKVSNALGMPSKNINTMN